MSVLDWDLVHQHSLPLVKLDSPGSVLITASAVLQTLTGPTICHTGSESRISVLVKTLGHICQCWQWWRLWITLATPTNQTSSSVVPLISHRAKTTSSVCTCVCVRAIRACVCVLPPQSLEGCSPVGESAAVVLAVSAAVSHTEQHLHYCVNYSGVTAHICSVHRFTDAAHTLTGAHENTKHHEKEPEGWFMCYGVFFSTPLHSFLKGQCTSFGLVYNSNIGENYTD